MQHAVNVSVLSLPTDWLSLCIQFVSTIAFIVLTMYLAKQAKRQTQIIKLQHFFAERQAAVDMMNSLLSAYQSLLKAQVKLSRLQNAAPPLLTNLTANPWYFEVDGLEQAGTRVEHTHIHRGIVADIDAMSDLYAIVRMRATALGPAAVNDPDYQMSMTGFLSAWPSVQDIIVKGMTSLAERINVLDEQLAALSAIARKEL